MAEFKEGMKKHVSAAREWLGKAERSFDQENDVRGDLSLMLAQAELQHAKEAKQSGKKRRSALGDLLLRAFAVVGIAALAFIAVWEPRPEPVRALSVPVALPAVKNEVRSVPLQEEPQRTRSVSEEMPVASPVPEAALPLETEAQLPLEGAELSETKTSMSVNKIQKQDVEVTPEQFRQLMRAAGKSLRGD